MGKEFTVTELSVPRLRTHWTGKWSFIYAVMSYSIGLGILWRFPNLMAKNGGSKWKWPPLYCPRAN